MKAMHFSRLCNSYLTLAALALLGSAPALASVIVYSDNFDSGSSNFTVGNSYWSSSADCNGYIIKTTGSASVCSGVFDQAGYYIANDASGNGYFLFDGTAGSAPDSEFYISSSFAVNPNTAYTVSFDLTNADTDSPAVVQPEINGTLLGSPVGALDEFPNGYGWQEFSFTWNSGSNTTAILTLNDYTATPDGNDFGIDNILVSSSAPEPGTFGMLGGAVAALGAGFLRKRISWAKTAVKQNV